MNDSTKTADFSFRSYIIRKFSFSEPTTHQENASIKFDPSGEFDVEKKTFKLILTFYSTYGEEGDPLFNLTIEGLFEFKEAIQLEDVPDYFYPNSIAILFPYVRAFVSIMTSVSNTKPLVLPLLNLSNLVEPLKKKTILKAISDY